MAGKVLIRGISQPGVGVEGIEGDQALADPDIPQFDGVVIGCRGQKPAVRGKGDAIDTGNGKGIDKFIVAPNLYSNAMAGFPA